MTIETELPAVKVRELEWQSDFAHTPFGLFYMISDYNGGAVLEKIEGSSTTKSAWPSRQVAKDAAQGDYERRILSAIVVHPAERGECHTLTAAARAFSELFVVDNGDPTLSVEDIDMMELTHRYVDLHAALDAAKEDRK